MYPKRVYCVKPRDPHNPIPDSALTFTGFCIRCVVVVRPSCTKVLAKRPNPKLTSAAIPSGASTRRSADSDSEPADANMRMNACQHALNEELQMIH